MGGLGALRLAFKHPTRFVAVAAVEPAVMPSATWQALPKRNRWFNSIEQWRRLHGNPINKKHWADNEPSNIVKTNLTAIRDSRIGIFLDCGNEDSLLLHEGAEYLHRVLWDHKVPHEYRLIDGADHIGRASRERVRASLRFVGNAVSPCAPDEERNKFKAMLKQAREIGGFDKLLAPKEN